MFNIGFHFQRRGIQANIKEYTVQGKLYLLFGVKSPFLGLRIPGCWMPPFPELALFIPTAILQNIPLVISNGKHFLNLKSYEVNINIIYSSAIFFACLTNVWNKTLWHTEGLCNMEKSNYPNVPSKMSLSAFLHPFPYKGRVSVKIQ